MNNDYGNDISVGAVSLTVADLERSKAFYTGTLGMQVQAESQDGLQLGVEGQALVKLKALPGAKPARKVTGLYHFAVLLPSRPALAEVLLQLARTSARIQGVADHGVSEAIYLADPDGNGIEIYRDLDEREWPRLPEGGLEMVTEELDVEGVIASLNGEQPAWRGMPAGTRMGHVHLHVSDLASAEAFYTQVIGLGLVQRYGPSAAFLASGRYHHHVGINTWAGQGAPQPPAGSTGLRWFELVFAGETGLQAALERAQAAGLEPVEQDGGYLVKDPAGNGVLLRNAER